MITKINLEQNSLYRDEFYELYPEYLEIDEIDENEEPFGSDGIDLGGIPTVSDKKSIFSQNGEFFIKQKYSEEYSKTKTKCTYRGDHKA